MRGSMRGHEELERGKATEHQERWVEERGKATDHQERWVEEKIIITEHY